MPVVQETRVQSQVESYQRLKKWYLMPSCLTLSIIRLRSRISGVILGKQYHPFLHLNVVAIEKRAFGSLSTTVGRLAYIKNYQVFTILKWLGILLIHCLLKHWCSNKVSSVYLSKIIVNFVHTLTYKTFIVQQRMKCLLVLNDCEQH